MYCKKSLCSSAPLRDALRTKPDVDNGRLFTLDDIVADVLIGRAEVGSYPEDLTVVGSERQRIVFGIDLVNGLAGALVELELEDVEVAVGRDHQVDASVLRKRLHAHRVFLHYHTHFFLLYITKITQFFSLFIH